MLPVDDDPEIRDSLRRGLSIDGHAISPAGTHTTGVRKLRPNTPADARPDHPLPHQEAL